MPCSSATAHLIPAAPHKVLCTQGAHSAIQQTPTQYMTLPHVPESTGPWGSLVVVGGNQIQVRKKLKKKTHQRCTSWLRMTHWGWLKSNLIETHIVLPLRILDRSYFPKIYFVVRDTKSNCNSTYITFGCSYYHLKRVFFCHLLSFLPHHPGSHPHE